MRQVAFAPVFFAAFMVLGPYGSANADPLHRWDGAYVGAHFGGAWSDAGPTTKCDDSNPGSVGTCAALNLAGLPGAAPSADADGVLGGFQAGYNFQMHDLVMGVEADFSWTDLGGSGSSSGPSPIGGTETVKFSRDFDWLGTLRGRIGWAVGDVFFYGTGGLAYADINSTYSYNGGPNVVLIDGAGDDTRFGYAAGGGIEYAIGKWSLKGEYLYFNLEDSEIRASAAVVRDPTVVGLKYDVHSDNDGHIARVGLNYHFE